MMNKKKKNCRWTAVVVVVAIKIVVGWTDVEKDRHAKRKTKARPQKHQPLSRTW